MSLELNNKRWIPLKPVPEKGTFAITAPSSPVDESKLNKGVRYLEKLGYNVKVGKSCYDELYYVAGSDENRAAELMRLTKDPQVDCILCARGGYGSMRLLDLLDYETIKNQRKPLIGFSDITALQWAIYTRTGLPSISGPLLTRDMGNDQIDPEFEEQFWDFIQSGITTINLKHRQEKSAQYRGTGLAGTLAVASWLIGTPYFPNTQNAILLLEDTEESIHKIEAYLMQWALAGFLKEAQACIMGNFTDISQSNFGKNPDLETVFNRVFQGMETTIVNDTAYGHHSSKVSVPIGVPYSLSLGMESKLQITQSIFEP